ncbi:MAG TPA: hypothetical protein V6D19_17785 [Stenomitos sp.]
MQSLIFSTTLLMGCTLSLGLAVARAIAGSSPPLAQTTQNLAQLPKGVYQFCSQPEPQGWQLGEGVCFWFRKQGNAVVGYYGYPHSDRLIDCVSGQLQGQKLSGQALLVGWAGNEWSAQTQQSTWDDEKYFRFASKASILPVRVGSEQVQLIRYPRVLLDLSHFYKYGAKKTQQMNPPPTSCDLQTWRKQTQQMGIPPE